MAAGLKTPIALGLNVRRARTGQGSKFGRQVGRLASVLADVRIDGMQQGGPNAGAGTG